MPPALIPSPTSPTPAPRSAAPAPPARRRGPGAGGLAALLLLALAACVGDQPRAEARLRAASLETVEVLARESAPARRELDDAGFEALAMAEMRRGEETALVFRNLRAVPYAQGALVCGEFRPRDASPHDPWRRFVGGALPGIAWTEFSADWITRAGNAGIVDACG